MKERHREAMTEKKTCGEIADALMESPFRWDELRGRITTALESERERAEEAEKKLIEADLNNNIKDRYKKVGLDVP